jgi:mono/diheme cytochrome c family protein
MHREGSSQLVAAAVSLVMLAGGRARAAAADAGTIEVWVRKAGAVPTAESPGRDRPQVVAIDSLPLAEVRRIDVQYHGAFAYRGVDLQTVIERFAPPPGVDLALLHFANGMQIPLAFRNAELMKSLSPFLARGIRLRPGRPMQVGRFPKISRPRSGFVDVRPITFAGNKLVVGNRDHPDVPEAARAVLSPWEHADSLTGIELVSQAAYDAQFDVDPDPGVKTGHRLFTQSCQFCHGVRRTGAGFGWDFVEPTPIAEYRGERNLFLHVKYKPLDATARAIQMPALSYMTEDDAKSVWLWLKAVADRPLRPYTP